MSLFHSFARCGIVWRFDHVTLTNWTNFQMSKLSFSSLRPFGQTTSVVFSTTTFYSVLLSWDMRELLSQRKEACITLGIVNYVRRWECDTPYIMFGTLVIVGQCLLPTTFWLDSPNTHTFEQCSMIVVHCRESSFQLGRWNPMWRNCSLLPPPPPHGRGSLPYRLISERAPSKGKDDDTEAARERKNVDLPRDPRLGWLNSSKWAFTSIKAI